uniref:homing endonuclease n=1 Tax=Leptographium wingfieldii TaxID=155675 RepID=UPI0023F01F02
NKRKLFNRNFHYNSKLYNNQNNNIIITDNNNSNNNNNNSNNNNNNNNKNEIPNYTKIFIENPFNNRKLILKLAKNQKGVYIWEDNNNAYVGHSINLYSRISSYFMPSILKTKARRVLRYFNKYGFENTNLTIYIMNENSSLDEVVRLEQYFINTLNPSLNVDLVASSSGHHEPMSLEIRDRLRKQRGTPVYVYNVEDFTLLYIYESKQHMYDSINIHHKTLSNCLNTGDIYLDTFFFSLDLIEESENTNLLSLEEIKELVSNKRDSYDIKHPAAKGILAEFKDDSGASSKNLEFPSLNSLANHLKGDRQIIREYLKGERSGYYRGKWKFTYSTPKVK